jgi:hypothetical protein
MKTMQYKKGVTDFGDYTDLEKIKVDNLDQLIRTMNLNKDSFDFSDFVRGRVSLNGDKTVKYELDNHCGTAACLAGWSGYLSGETLRKVGSGTFAGFVGVSYFRSYPESLEVQMCLESNFYGKSFMDEVTLEVVTPVLKDLLEQAMEAQEVSLEKA